MAARARPHAGDSADRRQRVGGALCRHHPAFRLLAAAKPAHLVPEGAAAFGQLQAVQPLRVHRQRVCHPAVRRADLRGGVYPYRLVSGRSFPGSGCGTHRAARHHRRLQQLSRQCRPGGGPGVCGRGLLPPAAAGRVPVSAEELQRLRPSPDGRHRAAGGQTRHLRRRARELGVGVRLLTTIIVMLTAVAASAQLVQSGQRSKLLSQGRTHQAQPHRFSFSPGEGASRRSVGRTIQEHACRTQALCL